MNTDRYKLHKIIEYVKLQEFTYEVEDVLIKLESVLIDLGLFTELTRPEYLEVVDELLPIAEAFEIREIERIVQQQNDELLIGVCRNPSPLQLRVEQNQRTNCLRQFMSSV